MFKDVLNMQSKYTQNANELQFQSSSCGAGERSQLPFYIRIRQIHRSESDLIY